MAGSVMANRDVNINKSGHHDIGGFPSQLKLATWCRELYYEPDRDLSDFIFNGIRYGFGIVDQGAEIESYECANYKSALSGEAKPFLDALIRSELAENKYVCVQDKPWCIHALGAVPKGSQEYRPITDCRRPIGGSINNFMESTALEFRFTSLDEVCKKLKQGTFMATIDIKSAYRSVSVRPDHWGYQGIQWELDGQQLLLVDTRLCFGLKCAPFIFSTLSDFVIRCLHRRGIYDVFCYLDDYIILGESFEACQQLQMQVVHLLIELGFYINWGKCSSPAQSCKYLGIEINSQKMQLSLPVEKLEKFHKELLFFKDRKKATKRQIQRLCGILNHCSKVVRGGRTFSNRVIKLLRGLPEKNVRVTLSKEFKLDLRWWLEFSTRFNGVSAIVESDDSCEVVSCDASKMGYGVTYKTNWLAGYYNDDSSPEDINYCQVAHFHWMNICVPAKYASNINVLEALPVLLMCRKFGRQWRNRKVMLYSDNSQVVSIVNKGVGQNEYCMKIIRAIFWESVLNNFHIVAEYIPGYKNVIPDYLSRIKAHKRIFGIDHKLCCSPKCGIG